MNLDRKCIKRLDLCPVETGEEAPIRDSEWTEAILNLRNRGVATVGAS